MAHKTQVHAEADKQELLITREFELPVELVFRAHIEPELLSQWMGTKVLKLEATRYGSWQFETTDAEGKVVFRANGVFHEFEPNRKITRTFEMENSPFPVQLEFLEFTALSDRRSRLTMHLIFKSVALRDQLLKMPFAAGISMAHDRLESAAGQLLPPTK